MTLNEYVATLETSVLTQAEIISVCAENGHKANPGMISRALKANGQTYKPARGGNTVNGSTKPIFWSKDFSESMRQLVKNGFINNIGIVANEDGTTGFNREVAAAIEKQFNASPLNADFAFIVRHIPESDWTLAGVETPAMRQARLDRELLAREKLESCKKHLADNGYKVVRNEPNFAQICAMFDRYDEQVAIATAKARLQAQRDRFAAKREKARILANQAEQQAQLHTAALVSEDLQAFADQKISEALKAANAALAEKQAAQDALQAMQAQMAAMQAQMQALMSAQAKPEKLRIAA